MAHRDGKRETGGPVHEEGGDGDRRAPKQHHPHRRKNDRHHSGRSMGKRITSRIFVWSARIIVSRSTPNPTPPAGGMPYSNARRKSSSSCWASTSPAARKTPCCSKRRRCSSGSFSSLNALASSRC